MASEEGLKFDSGKIDYNLIPPHALEGVAKVMTYGATKYGPFNWVHVNPKERYLSAAYRHIEAVRKGENIDTIESGGSGLLHIDHAICSLIMFREITRLEEDRKKM